MPLGWIDFSKNERNKVLNVLDLLSEAGTLDELGIGPIRDGFANLFFPGTSTLQTRAKYFLIVPYAIKDLELADESNPNRILRSLDETEKECGKILVAGEDTAGVIGKRSLVQGGWVKSTPADAYWAGLRNYGIFRGGTLSLAEYARAMCAMKKKKTVLTKLGSSHDAEEEGAADDKDAGELFRMQFWKIPTYHEHWIDDLSIKLTKEEGAFLKGQMMGTYPDSMMAYILRNGLRDVIECKSFQEMSSLINVFPEQIQRDYALANDFSEFLFVLRTVYNMIVSDGRNEDANLLWGVLQPDLQEMAVVDLESIFSRLSVSGNVFLCNFLRRAQDLMKDGDLEGMKNEIRRRERELKGSRAKTLHPGEFDSDSWIGGRYLDYRYDTVKVILRDIFESEGTYAKSEQ